MVSFGYRQSLGPTFCLDKNVLSAPPQTLWPVFSDAGVIFRCCPCDSLVLYSCGAGRRSLSSPQKCRSTSLNSRRVGSPQADLLNAGGALRGGITSLLYPAPRSHIRAKANARGRL